MSHKPGTPCIFLCNKIDKRFDDDDYDGPNIITTDYVNYKFFGFLIYLGN